jgi:hypothetical protein
MVVLGHLQIPPVLSDLQGPEAGRQRPEHDGDNDLQHRHAPREPPSIFSYFHC